MTETSDQPPQEALIFAMTEALSVSDVEAGRSDERLILAGFHAREINPVIDEVNRRVMARKVRAALSGNAGVAVVVLLAVLTPDVALAADGFTLAQATGMIALSAFAGAVIGFAVCALLAAGRDADERAGACPWDQRSPTGSCQSCGAQRGQRCRGEGA